MISLNRTTFLVLQFDSITFSPFVLCFCIWVVLIFAGFLWFVQCCSIFFFSFFSDPDGCLWSLLHFFRHRKTASGVSEGGVDGLEWPSRRPKRQCCRGEQHYEWNCQGTVAGGRGGTQILRQQLGSGCVCWWFRRRHRGANHDTLERFCCKVKITIPNFLFFFVFLFNLFTPF